MMGRLPLLGIGLLSYLGALIAFAPASWVVEQGGEAWLKARNLALTGIEGRWHEGSADLAFAGKGLGRLSWNLEGASLIRFEPPLRVELISDTGALRGRIGRDDDSRVIAAPLEGEIPLSVITPFIPELAPVNPGGRVGLDLQLLDWGESGPNVIEGEVTWRDASLSLPRKMILGELAVEFRPAEEGESIGVISDRSGPLEASGEVRLNRDREFDLDLRLATRGTDRQGLGRLLGRLGKRDPEGGVLLRQKGRW
jgi:hypothetical protein